MARSKSSMPPSTWAARSSAPTMSAPAARASSAAGAVGEDAPPVCPCRCPTAGRRCRGPSGRPCGGDPEPTASSTDSSKLGAGQALHEVDRLGHRVEVVPSNRFVASECFLPFAMSGSLLSCHGRPGEVLPVGRRSLVSARRGDHGLLQGVQRRNRDPAGHDHPRRDHDLRGPLVHVHPQDAAHAGAAARRPPASTRARRPRAGRSVGTDHRRAGRPRSPRSKMPDLNANDLEAAKQQVAGTARSMGINVV